MYTCKDCKYYVSPNGVPTCCFHFDYFDPEGKVEMTESKCGLLFPMKAAVKREEAKAAKAKAKQKKQEQTN